jgi:hypothetical protein
MYFLIFCVSELPPEDPQIIGLRDIYQLGDELQINCSVGPSRPEANIKWLVNGRTVSSVDRMDN